MKKAFLNIDTKAQRPCKNQIVVTFTKITILMQTNFNIMNKIIIIFSFSFFFFVIETIHLKLMV